MPDRDGIERFSNSFGCAWCQASQLTITEAEKHRKRCGPKWRATYGPKRKPNADEILVAKQLSQGVEE
jgi:hypothetical protein